MFRRRRFVLAATTALLAPYGSAHGFCGFYVAKADADLWNQASQVAVVRDGERTVLTMSNDYQGELDEFAVVVPVPTVLQRGQIHVGERKLMERLDAFSAPRLVEYFDDDPCRRMVVLEMAAADAGGGAPSARARARAKSLGVTIEASYTVGEYDILILSAEQSDGLETWLTENGYKLPAGASKALRPYIKQDMKFFVAKVNLKEQAKTGYSYLRPLQMAFESKRFMLPIRLGMLNANGPQDLLVYVLTRKGRVETTNYQTVRVPSEQEIPLFVKDPQVFADFYRAMFARAWEREGKDAVFLEYFWNMGWCDPCAADPLTRAELRELGVFWLDESAPDRPSRPPIRRRPVGPVDVQLTRLHVRYDDAHFPEDLMFQETGDKQNFQGRYILRHPWTGDSDCEEARAYRRELKDRRERQAKTLAHLTGWDLADIRAKMGPDPEVDEPEPWWKRLWKDE